MGFFVNAVADGPSVVEDVARLMLDVVRADLVEVTT